ncbi:hypothetical protein ACFLSQ_00075 [Bacteroidota bacterium]
MTTIQKNVINIITSLSEKKLKDAYNYLMYLKDKDEWEATYELADNQILSEIKEGLQQLREGKIEYLKEIRRDV